MKQTNQSINSDPRDTDVIIGEGTGFNRIRRITG